MSAPRCTMKPRLPILFASLAMAACTAGEGSHGDGEGADDAGDDGASSASGAPGAGGAGTGGSTGPGGGGGEEPCPAGLVCVKSFPFSHTSSTVGAASDAFDTYACGPQDESGPEVVYQVDVPSDGFLWLRLGGLAASVDVDVHLLGSLDAGDCIDRGHWDVGELLPAGRYYVTVDTWVSGDGVAAAGGYTLDVGLVTEAHLQSWGMSATVAGDALHVLDRAWSEGLVETSAYAVVDFSLHAAEKRVWVFDAFTASLRHHTYTTVGEASDPNGDGWADAFSNLSGSNQSSIGLVKAAETYVGDYGESVRLDGLEPGYNDNVRPRTIVLHPWAGSTPAYVASHPTTGAAPTWGCLGIDPTIVLDVRDFLANGGLILSHFPDGDWSTSSAFLN